MQKKICFLHMELSHREIPSLQKEFKDEAERRAYEKYQRNIAACRAKEQEEELRVLRAYGKLKYDNTITRDIIVPAEMPLYAVII